MLSLDDVSNAVLLGELALGEDWQVDGLVRSQLGSMPI